MDEEREILCSEPAPSDGKEAKKSFSRAGWGAAAILIIGSLAQIGVSALVGYLAPELMQRPWALWVFTFAPLYLIGFPLGMLILSRSRRFEGEGDRMGAGGFFRALLVSFFMMYAGSLIGNLINTLLQSLAGVPAGNPLMTYATDDSLLLKILVMVVLAPVLEELIFRKLLIDRLRGYGETLAVLTSALIFGLFHGNLSQFFYAVGLGLVFGYVYLRTRQLRWSIALHMIVNCIGSVLAPALLAKSSLDPGAAESALGAVTPGNIAYLVYAVCFLGLAIAGLVTLIRRARTLRFDPAPEELPKGRRFAAAFLNAGMLVFVLASLGLIVYSALAVG